MFFSVFVLTANENSAIEKLYEMFCTLTVKAPKMQMSKIYVCKISEKKFNPS